jgi:DNA-binding response OmpR family regulator
MRILLVEDDHAIAHVIRRGLEAAGFAVEAVEDGGSGLEAAQRSSYDLMILDLMLPGMDGESVCRELRAQGRRLPVLMLTARDGLDDKIRGFEAGADDYLSKPFHFAELLARVQALLRREHAVVA